MTLACVNCGKELNSDGMHPAETYAGTYTGLCYSCQNSESYIIEKFSDGAMIISYPPHCPSFRRDREHYTAYSDCPKCKGTGRYYISRCMSQGGPYYGYCTECSKRFGEHNEESYMDSKILGYPVKCYRKINRIWAMSNDENKMRYCL